MKIFRFDPEVGNPIGLYNSSGLILTRVAHLFEAAMIHCAYLQPNGQIGYHQAVVPQLFLVLQGEGWALGEAAERTLIQSGQAAYWVEGEWHAAGTETGMTAIMIEAVDFKPSGWTPLA